MEKCSRMDRQRLRTNMIRMCAECSRLWKDNGDPVCPFCGSENTFVVDDLRSPAQADSDKSDKSYAEGEI